MREADVLSDEESDVVPVSLDEYDTDGDADEDSVTEAVLLAVPDTVAERVGEVVKDAV